MPLPVETLNLNPTIKEEGNSNLLGKKTSLKENPDPSACMLLADSGLFLEINNKYPVCSLPKGSVHVKYADISYSCSAFAYVFKTRTATIPVILL